MRCRYCRTPKWKGDPCPNPDCRVNTTPAVKIRGRNGPISATTRHGFHAPLTTTTSLVSDYDAPIRAKSWKKVS